MYINTIYIACYNSCSLPYATIHEAYTVYIADVDGASIYTVYIALPTL